MKLGAIDFLQKPFEVEELLVVVQRALAHQRLSRQHRYLIAEREEEFEHYGIIGSSERMRDVIRTAELVAASRSTVLITGETGTGKELVARAIHDRSAERDRPLIKVSCAAIPENLLESELFGHTRGAFTGAAASKKGRFALADGGSIFLDEVGTIPLSIQAKLLRVLQEREFESLGSERTQRVDVRVITATNRDLKQMVNDDQFLEDLFYRLNVIPIEIPPLRQRAEDIPALVDAFVAQALPAGRQSDHRPRSGSDRSVVRVPVAGQRPGIGELDRARRRVVDRRDDPTDPAGCFREVGGYWRWAAVAQPEAQCGVGGGRDGPPSARCGGWGKESRGRAAWPDTQSAQPLSPEARAWLAARG